MGVRLWFGGLGEVGKFLDGRWVSFVVIVVGRGLMEGRGRFWG